MNILLDLAFSTANDTIVGFFSTIFLFPLTLLTEILVSMLTPSA